MIVQIVVCTFFFFFFCLPKVISYYNISFITVTIELDLSEAFLGLSRRPPLLTLNKKNKKNWAMHDI